MSTARQPSATTGVWRRLAGLAHAGAAHCREVPAGAMYGLPAGGDWGGLFDDVVRVTYANAMLTPLSAGVDPVDAVAAGDNLGLGYQILTRHLAAGARRFLILGGAAVGINQTAFAVALGAEEVVYVDDVPSHRDVASRLGATAAAGPPDRTLGTFDVAIDASFNPGWLRRSLRMVDPEGTVECLGGYFGDEPLPLLAMYARASHSASPGRATDPSSSPHSPPSSPGS